jgi:hypothetical protein
MQEKPQRVEKGTGPPKYLVEAFEKQGTPNRRLCAGTLEQLGMPNIQALLNARNAELCREIIAQVKEERKGRCRVAEVWSWGLLLKLGAGVPP